MIREITQSMKMISHWDRPLGSQNSALRHADMDRVGIGQALVDSCFAGEACTAIIAHAKSVGEPAYVITANAQHIVLLDRDPRLREIYDRADLVVADGISLLLAARMYGRSLQERVAGVDMFQTLCELAAQNNLHVFLLGGHSGSAELAASVLKRRSPSLCVSTYCPPLGFEKTPSGLEKTAEAIRKEKPHLLFVAFGAPKQEYWIAEHGLRLAVPICIGVGGSFEMTAGVTRRAPGWIQGLGCEWLFRLCLEPRRLWRRYLIGNLQFAGIVARQRVRITLLAAFVYLLDRCGFGAEMYEPKLEQRRKRIAAILKFQAVKSGDVQTPDAAGR